MAALTTHADKARARHADSAPFFNWANVAVAVTCLFDYLVQARPWALETLAIAVLLLNGGGILIRRYEIRAATARDLEDLLRASREEAARDARLRARGLR